MYKLVYLCLLIMVQNATDGTKTGFEYNAVAGAWIRQYTDTASYSDAEMHCRDGGGRMLTPYSAAMTQEMLALLAKRQLMRTMFTGIKSLISKENVKIIGGLPLTSVPMCWVSGVPAYADVEDCLALSGVGTLVEVDCSNSLPYFCRQDNATITRNLCGDVGYKVDLQIGSCYRFHKTPRTWYDAYVACHREDAQLAVINSVEEAEFLRRMFKDNNSPEQVIIGIRSRAGVWFTIDEESLQEAGYDSWAPGEPNNKKRNEMCGFMHHSGLLNDDSCDKRAPFICEIIIN